MVVVLLGAGSEEAIRVTQSNYCHYFEAEPFHNRGVRAEVALAEPLSPSGPSLDSPAIAAASRSCRLALF